METRMGFSAFDFAIVAFAIFMMIQALNKLKRQAPPPAAPSESTKEEKLLTEIRDILRIGGLRRKRHSNPPFMCAVQRHGLSAGANPARQLSLQPEQSEQSRR
ncbi:MAG: MscL family protein [Gammaproteobacteria bacterium]|nr:MscL family protein [Gammaproteobacteria bacterium]